MPFVLCVLKHILSLNLLSCRLAFCVDHFPVVNNQFVFGGTKTNNAFLIFFSLVKPVKQIKLNFHLNIILFNLKIEDEEIAAVIDYLSI